MIPKIQRFGSLSLLILILSSISTAQQKPNQNQCLESNKAVKKRLDKGNTLYWAIEKNETGSGVFLPWMNTMRTLNIKHATGEVYFYLRNDEIALSIRRINFFNRYYDFRSEVEAKTESEFGYTPGLTASLKFAFFRESIKFLEDIKMKNNTCGVLYLSLLDDACLPLSHEMPQIESKCN